jgi:HSP20 family protein
MNKILQSILALSLFGTVVSAENSFIDSDYKSEFQAMQKYLDRMMQTHIPHSQIGNIGYPRLNVQNTKENYIYEFDLAGIPKENIKLSIDENNVLTLSGTKEEKGEKKSDKYVKQEIFYGSFTRVIKLPDDINQDKLETKYDNGILKLTIGKKAPKKTKSKVLEIK